MKAGPESDSDEYKDEKDKKPKRRATQRKRRKVDSGQDTITDDGPNLLDPMLFFDELGNGDPTVASFQDIIDRELPDLLRCRAILQEKEIEIDEQGQHIRPPTRSEVSSFIHAITIRNAPPSLSSVITERKLKLIREKRLAGLPQANIQASSTVTPLLPLPANLPVPTEVLEALYNIRTTPFETSFLSRLQGTGGARPLGAIGIDWETITPWMSLMDDIREHYVLSHPESEYPVEILAPITYISLQMCHLEQVHDLLERVFWHGINVSDSLDHSPERCTVVATYKRLVVGVAILSSPRETYITYLAVRAGWDNARIARSMLYHLIVLNPNKDITLHVSVNNSAMLLYNRFGFKAEEFVAGFYEDYLDPQSRASTNAFRLRLRQQ